MKGEWGRGISFFLEYSYVCKRVCLKEDRISLKIITRDFPRKF
ncbi:hypothetical protein HMPREF1981_00504 [Bacteroides pyogenes F0041]|uniref:Uncharacterized protein n=1 Tax=Bacteroides pyogenes F0041 TaxID=1321819 RepID=U2CVC8_9BACE|nr:hypothetical protein HMPREF1981_00504 [Bacteroides pyogenes F0041]